MEDLGKGRDLPWTIVSTEWKAYFPKPCILWLLVV